MDENKYPLVSVVIPTYNRSVALMQLLKSVFSSTYKNVELVIVNDCSTDNTLEMLKHLMQEFNYKITVITNSTNKNLTISRNTGLRHTAGKYIFLIDDDNVLHESCIADLVNVLENNMKAGMVGPMMYYYKLQNKIWWAGTHRNMTTTRTFFIGRDYPIPLTDTWETDDFPNACMFRREIIDKDIFFDESLVIHYDEPDFAMRVRKLCGYSLLVVRKATIYHDVAPDDTKGLSRRWLDVKRVFFTARNRVVFHKRYSNKYQYLAFILFWNWIFTLFYINYIFRVPDAPLVARLKSMGAYVKGAISGLTAE